MCSSCYLECPGAHRIWISNPSALFTVRISWYWCFLLMILNLGLWTTNLMSFSVPGDATVNICTNTWVDQYVNRNVLLPSRVLEGPRGMNMQNCVLSESRFRGRTETERRHLLVSLYFGLRTCGLLWMRIPQHVKRRSEVMRERSHKEGGPFLFPREFLFSSSTWLSHRVPIS